jgi:2'-5' RNA ligase
MRFSVVCYLDSDSTNIVRCIQQKLGELTGARASLDLWKPHVTVGDGIEVDEGELMVVKSAFEESIKSTSPFYVSMRDILKVDFREGGTGETTTPYGLYLDVVRNDDLLGLVEKVSKVSKKLSKWYFMPIPYHPHCALAFKDLDKDGFIEGARYLDDQTFDINARIDHVALVEMLPDETRELYRFNFS